MVQVEHYVTASQYHVTLRDKEGAIADFCRDKWVDVLGLPSPTIGGSSKIRGNITVLDTYDWSDDYPQDSVQQSPYGVVLWVSLDLDKKHFFNVWYGAPPIKRTSLAQEWELRCYSHADDGRNELLWSMYNRYWNRLVQDKLPILPGQLIKIALKCEMEPEADKCDYQSYGGNLTSDLSDRLRLILQACVRLHISGACYCIWSEKEGYSWHYSETKNAIEQHLGRSLDTAEVSALSLTRCYGQCPLLFQDEYDYLTARHDHCSWLELAARIESEFSYVPAHEVK